MFYFIESTHLFDRGSTIMLFSIKPCPPQYYFVILHSQIYADGDLFVGWVGLRHISKAFTCAWFLVASEIWQFQKHRQEWSNGRCLGYDYYTLGRIVPFRIVPFGVSYIIRRRLCVTRSTMWRLCQMPWSDRTSNKYGSCAFFIYKPIQLRIPRIEQKLWLIVHGTNYRFYSERGSR